MFRNTGANVFAKNQMRLAYEDKRDLYCNNGINQYAPVNELVTLGYFYVCTKPQHSIRSSLNSD